LRQRPVSDLTPCGTTHRLDFPRAERREVVVQHEALPGFTCQAINFLLIRGGTQGAGNNSLSLSALKQCRTMCSRQHAGFAHDRSNRLKIASVDTFARVEYHVAYNRGLAPIELAENELLVGSENIRPQLLL